MNESREDTGDEEKPFIEGRDFYFDNGLMVLTRYFLLNRGYCCERGCRHCPYNETEEPAASE
jgi:Family of unknown function (DUF5522)